MFIHLSRASLAAFLFTACIIVHTHAEEHETRSTLISRGAHEASHARLRMQRSPKPESHHGHRRHHKHSKIRIVAPKESYTKPSEDSYTKSSTKSHSVVAVDLSDKSDGYISASGSKSIISIGSVSSACGSARPSDSITESSGPNGSQDFLNCGITSGGWNPADVKMSMIKTLALDAEPAKTTFAPCQQYASIFKKYGAKYDVPPIFLAAFAMQESSCKADVKGDNGGAWGLMQITQDKCGGAPGGNCADPDYNINMGAKTFADGLSSAGGNVLIALAAYNGWNKGMTKAQATAAKNTGCCVCQQNLDYLQQFLNGWILGVDPYSKKLGMMRNLDSCGDGY